MITREIVEDHEFRKWLAGGTYKVCLQCECDFYPDDDDKYCPDCLEDEGRGTVLR